jgi:lysozyme family protein
MRAMRTRHRRAWMRRLRILVLAACALALAVPASAHAAPSQDLRSPDARDAARDAAPAQPQAQEDPGPARSTRVVESTSSGDQTVAIALASAAIAIALAGLTVALGALFRRPRSRWSVS